MVVSGMDAPHLEAALSAAPEFAAPAARPRCPATRLRYFWKRAPRSLDELTENARPTAESFRGRAEGGLLADEIVPDWSALMVQFQNLDPFQHRAWPYLNVDETGHRRPRVERGGGRGHPRARRGDRPALRAGRPPRRGGHGGQRPRLRPLPGPDPRQPHPGRRRRGPAARLGRAGSGAGPCRRAIGSGSGARSATTRRRARRRSTSRSPPSSRFDWKRTLAFAPHQDTAAMVYLNSAARHGGVKTPPDA